MIKYEVKENIGTISENPVSNWKKELNIVNWNDTADKYDIREWSPEHDKMSKGVTMNEEEALHLMELLAEHFDMILLERED